MRRPSQRMDDGTAFLPDPRDGRSNVAPDELAETLAEEFVTSATSAEEASEDVRDGFVSEEIGGPFINESGNEEFADDDDPQNPPDGTKEPFPTAVARPRGE